MNYKTFKDLSDDIKNNLYKLHNQNYDLVVGIPRSGMIPAYMIGLYLNINVTEIDGLLENSRLANGITRHTRSSFDTTWEAKKILVVDDSILTGESLKASISKIPNNLHSKLTTLAVYSNTHKRKDVDIILERLSSPRVFEWNVFHKNLLSKSCVDIDGVLCFDPTDEDNDDGMNYRKFLLSAKPYIIPTHEIHSLVTSRLEKYRPETEEWLKNNGIKYKNLIMLDLPSKEERQRQNAHASHKAKYYKNENFIFFIESNYAQAKTIMESTGKPVFCVDKNKILRPSISNVLMKSPMTFKDKLRSKSISMIPKSIKPVLKKTYGLIVKDKNYT